MVLPCCDRSSTIAAAVGGAGITLDESRLDIAFDDVPLVKNGLLYTIDSKGVLLCLDAQTGETIWSEKLKGKYNSSLLWAAGNIYFSSIRGETFVIREGRSLDVIAENSLDGEIWATPAFIDGCILLRTSQALYKIRKGVYNY